MIPNIGPLEIAIVLIIALIVFGPKRLPELGKSLGRGLTEFREGISNAGQPDEDDEADEDDEEPAELTPPTGDRDNVSGEEPEVIEVTSDSETEIVDGEVVSGSRE